MQKPNSTEFYVGYLDRMPSGLAQFYKRNLIVLCVFIVVLVSIFAYLQSKFDRGRFDFYTPTEYIGFLRTFPLPHIQTEMGETYLLVGDGKFGAFEWAETNSNQWVRFSAKLIERKPLKMLEVERNTLPQLVDIKTKSESVVKSYGQMTLTGELVDSKCYLGVMRPATGKVHRACAIRCLSGGVPPGILLRHADIDLSVMILLSGPDGKLDFDKEWAGKNVSASGEFVFENGLPILKTSKIILL